MGIVDGVMPPNTETLLPSTHPVSTPALTTTQTVKKRKVLYVLTKSNFGSAQRYVCDLVSHPAPDTEIAVLCAATPDTAPGEFLLRKLQENNVRTVVLPELARDIGFLDFAAFYKVFKAIRAESPDVLHLNSSKTGGPSALAGRLCRVPRIIYTAHGWAFNGPGNIFSKILLWFGSVTTIIFSHKVICVSTYDRGAFSGLFFRKKIVAIHNAPCPPEYEDREEARRNLVPHSELYLGDIWIGSITELTANKNFDVALRAVARALDSGCKVFYAIIGDGKDRLALEDMVLQMKIDQNVKFLGFVSDAQRRLKAFDAILFTSGRERLPYCVLESLDAGVPIIAASVGGITEIVRNGEDGILCQSENVDQFADAIIRFVKDETLRKQLAINPPRNQFENMLRETFALYLPAGRQAD